MESKKNVSLYYFSYAGEIRFSDVLYGWTSVEDVMKKLGPGLWAHPTRTYAVVADEGHPIFSAAMFAAICAPGGGMHSSNK